jgi:hypothetical protein
MREYSLILAFIVLTLSPPLRAHGQENTQAEQAVDPRESICLMIESAAKANALPVDFFARVIWQESRFRPDEVGPVTRSGARAQGIAQFMPVTAAERGLTEPLDPVQALPKSSQFLAELRDQFGNLGLAAAAYNAGPGRVREFIAGSRALPTETRNYVLAITGRPVEDWLKGNEERAEASRIEPDAAGGSCRDLVALLGHPPILSLAALQQHFSAPALPQRKVPSWCRHLYHPNVSVCGSVHQVGPAIKTAGLVGSRGRSRAMAIRSKAMKN